METKVKPKDDEELEEVCREIVQQRLVCLVLTWFWHGVNSSAKRRIEADRSNGDSEVKLTDMRVAVGRSRRSSEHLPMS